MIRQHTAAPVRDLPRLVAAILLIVAMPGLAERVGAGERGAPEEFDEVLAEERDLVEDLEELETISTDLSGRIEALEGELAAARSTLAAAEDDEEAARLEARHQSDLEREATEEVARTRELLAAQAVAAYVTGGDESVAGALLRARSSEDAETALVYSEAVLDDTDELIDRFERAEERQRRTAEAARDAKRLASRHRAAASEAEATLTSAHEQHERLRLALESNAAELSAKLDEVRTRKVVLQTTVTAQRHASDGVQQLLAAVQAGQPAWSRGAVTMTTPLPGHSIGSPFGMRHHPVLGIDRLHAGSDMGAATGTPIHAAGDGMVVFAGDRGGFGNVVIIDHGHQLGTVYAHQSSIGVTTGQRVNRGEVIGRVGSTGLSTGPHLHFETRILGVPVDPPSVVDFTGSVAYGP